MSLLTATGITKRFGGITALDRVSLEVEGGEAVGLVGPNGAGKTTMFNCLLGMLAPDAGQVRFDGQDLAGRPIHARARLGIGRTFQRIELFTGMTVREHLLVAERSRNGTGRVWKDLVGRGRPSAPEHDRAEQVLDLLDLGDVADTPVEALTLGRGRLVEIGRALMIQPRLLLLDEPSSGLDIGETAQLSAVLNALRAEQGTTLLLVEHDLQMVADVAERIYVLDFGQLIAEGPAEQVMSDPAVRRAYLGEAV